MTDMNTLRHLEQVRRAMTFHYVQLRVDTVTTCARLLETFHVKDGTEIAKLDLQGPWHGPAFSPVSRLIRCDGVDGGCSCAGEIGIKAIALAAKESAAKSALACDAPAQAVGSAVPHGNHGDNNFSASSGAVSLS